MAKKYQNHGPIPSHDFRGNSLSIERREPGDREESESYGFLARPDPAARAYDSSLSKPGRICSAKYCRAFVPGTQSACPDLWHGGLEGANLQHNLSGIASRGARRQVPNRHIWPCRTHPQISE